MSANNPGAGRLDSLMVQLRAVPRPVPAYKALAGLPPRIRQILDEVGAEHGWTRDELRSGSRVKTLVIARNHAMYRLKVECRHLSKNAIGMILCRDRATVWYGIRKHAEMNGLPVL